MNSGSLESFQVSWRCGWSPNAFQIRCTADCVSPTSRAIDRVDQCVASLGVVSSVLTITCSTCSSLIVRGPPGRGSSVSPSSRCARNRARHLPATLRWIPSRSAISVFLSASAASNTIRDRSANACAFVRRRVQDSNCARSSTDSATAATKEEGITPSSPQAHELMHHDTRLEGSRPGLEDLVGDEAVAALLLDEREAGTLVDPPGGDQHRVHPQLGL